MTTNTSILNLEAISVQAYVALHRLDKTFVGSDEYMGVAYFWAWDYRHYLRDVSYAKRRQVHRALLRDGLDVDSASDEHESIIKDIVFRKRKSHKSCF